jgi:hypothetical protein
LIIQESYHLILSNQEERINGIEIIVLHTRIKVSALRKNSQGQIVTFTSDITFLSDSLKSLHRRSLHRQYISIQKNLQPPDWETSHKS